MFTDSPGDKFQLLGILEQMSEAAKDVGVKNFKTRFKGVL